ncbi:MAG: right-handed parallel beta-helix repeat-containing protein [Spirochaetes bacterium]|nr:right-handed parallel beta-helix repeat-containing protein [Spirochaetota bacterium]
MGRLFTILVAAAVMTCCGCSGCHWPKGNRGNRNLLFSALLRNAPLANSCRANFPGAITACGAATYYVDFDGGNDANDGRTATTPWKHCPGDDNATGIPATTTLQPGNMVVFRGGVRYRGSITLQSGGAADNPIVFKGDCAGFGSGQAVLDGSEQLTGWTACSNASDCGGNPNWGAIYHTTIPAQYGVTPFTANLHENGDFLWVAQEPDQPDPYFWDEVDNFYVLPVGAMATTSLVDTANLNQADSSYWNNSSVALWINPNIVVVRDILTYDPAAHRITFASVGGGGVYTDRETGYAIFNSIHALDEAGEYYIHPVANGDGSHTVYLWPNNAANLGTGISVSARSFGIDLAGVSNVVIEGFTVQKFSGNGLTDGVGIGTVSLAYRDRSNITIRNNTIRHNRKGTDSGYGGIYLGNCTECLVENNTVVENVRHSGIFLGGGSCSVVRGNTVTRAGSTSIRFYGVTCSQIVGNTVNESNGSHANGITLYLSCNTILVARNRVLDSNSPITFQDSGNLFFVRNLIDAADRGSNVNEWPPAHTDGSFGTISFLNNTLVRNNRNASLNIGTYGASPYVSVNNIIDGGGSAGEVRRDYNIYTGLSWSQAPSYGWSLGAHESVVTDMGSLFIDPGNGDFHLAAGSPAVNAGTDITGLLPMISFPFFNFWIDIEGNPVAPGSADIGACERQ